MAERLLVQGLPLPHQAVYRLGLGGRVRSQFRLAGEAADAERDDPHRGEPRVLVEDPGEGVLEHGAVVDAGAHHDLPVHLDARLEQDPEPAQACGTPGIAQHVGPHGRIRGVDGHVERSQALVDDSLGVELGEAGERREVSVEEGEPVVVVLHVQAAAHALGELVDETERTVVVARAYPVEERRGHLQAGRLAGLLLDAHRFGQDLSPAPHEDVDLRLVHDLGVGDDVPGHPPVEADELVTCEHPRHRCRRRLGDRRDPWL